MLHRLPRLTLPPPPAALLLIVVAFVLPGLVGHEPWKTPDVISIEIAREMLRTGDWLVPRVAGLALLDHPPLFYWLAALSGRLLGWALPFHDAARLSSGVVVFAALAFMYAAARSWSEDDAGRAPATSAVLLLIGSIGLMVPTHAATPDLLGLAACAGALAALARGHARPATNGAAFGAALGVAFLAGNSFLAVSLALAGLALPAACPEWRRRRGVGYFASAAVVGRALAASWPLALWLHAPDLFARWWVESLAPQGDVAENLSHMLGIASWFTWPAWPLALRVVLLTRRRWREPRFFAPLAATLAIFVGAGIAGPAEDVSMALVLPPLVLLAAQGVTRLPRGAAAAFDWFAVMTFTFFVSLVWLGYVAMVAGVPAQISHNFAKLAPGFPSHFAPLPFAVALALTLGWLYLVLRTAPSLERGVARWAGGVVLLWGTLVTLWMPWIDHQRSYQAVSLQLKSLIPTDAACVAGSGLGIAQRAALDYHARIRVVQDDAVRAADCPVLLVQGSPEYEQDRPSGHWRKIADVGRPGDRLERYRLYRRER